jgi:TrmH family RNA methyltransferase
MRIISGRQNPAVRVFRSLATSADVTGERLLLDGAHLVREARDAGASFEIVAVASSRLARDTEEGVLAQSLERDGVDVVMAPDQLFAAMSPVRTPSGIIAVAQRRPASPSEMCARPDALTLVAIDVQDPGNLGSLLRAAEAGGVTGALVCDTPSRGSANPFSWKALRGSMGSALRLPVAAGLDASDALAYLRRAGATSVAAVPRGGSDPDALDWCGSIGIVLGGEGPGLSDEIVSQCDLRVTIPMAPRVESLNVAVAGGLLVYAARRARMKSAGPSAFAAPQLRRDEEGPAHDVMTTAGAQRVGPTES